MSGFRGIPIRAFLWTTDTTWKAQAEISTSLCSLMPQMWAQKFIGLVASGHPTLIDNKAFPIKNLILASTYTCIQYYKLQIVSNDLFGKQVCFIRLGFVQSGD